MGPKTWSAFAVLLLVTAAGAGDDVKRPRITGISHIALYVKDVDKSLAFYKDFLGFAEPYRLNKGKGGLHLTFIKINDRQCIELFPEKEAGTDRLYHIALETDDAEAMRKYLASRGVKVPEQTSVGRIGNANYFIADPDGHSVEIVQYLPDGWTLKDKGKNLPESRISSRIMHLGIACGSLERSLAFYRDILGCREVWRGSASGKSLSWVNLMVPDGEDYLELMLYKGALPTNRLGTMHHVCLEVPDLDKAKKTLEGRPLRQDWRMEDIRTGINRKRQLNLFDPDGTRIELMEPRTVDGVPTPSSQAPPPNP